MTVADVSSTSDIESLESLTTTPDTLTPTSHGSFI